jgi:hypothetical protein
MTDEITQRPHRSWGLFLGCGLMLASLGAKAQSGAQSMPESSQFRDPFLPGQTEQVHNRSRLSLDIPVIDLHMNSWQSAALQKSVAIGVNYAFISSKQTDVAIEIGENVLQSNPDRFSFLEIRQLLDKRNRFSMGLQSGFIWRKASVDKPAISENHSMGAAYLRYNFMNNSHTTMGVKLGIAKCATTGPAMLTSGLVFNPKKL